MSFTGAATGGTLNVISVPSLNVAQLNAVTGYPAQETYPGAITTDHSGTGQTEGNRVPGPGGGAAPPGFPSQAYQPDLSSGEAGDSQAQFGHAAEIAPFDNQRVPFAPPGVLDPVHTVDTGGTHRTEHVPMPRSPGWWRRTIGMQTFNRQSFVTDTSGWQQNVPNGRMDLNQDQGQNADGYHPFTLPYSERPIRAKFAYEAFPVETASSVYGVNAVLDGPQLMGGQGNTVYEAPPDPTVNVQPVQQTATSQPTLGMEYVSG